MPQLILQVSPHLARIYNASKNLRWYTSAEIANEAKIAKRTARAHCLRLVQAGVFEQRIVFPEHRYRLASDATKKNKELIKRLEEALTMFGESAK